MSSVSHAPFFFASTVAVNVSCRIQDNRTVILLSEGMVHRKDPVQDPLQYSPDRAHQSWSTRSCRLSHQLSLAVVHQFEVTDAGDFVILLTLVGLLRLLGFRGLGHGGVNWPKNPDFICLAVHWALSNLVPLSCRCIQTGRGTPTSWRPTNAPSRT